MSNSKQFNLSDGSVAFAQVPLDPANSRPIIGRDAAAIMAGYVNGTSVAGANARRTALPNGIATLIEEIATQQVVSSAGLTMTIRSTNAGDTSQILVLALGAGYARLQPIVVTLTGTTPITLNGGTPITRINAMARLSGDLAGQCLIENAGQTYGFISAGGQGMRSSRFTVPANYQFFLTDISGSLLAPTGVPAGGNGITFSLQGKPSQSTGYGELFGWTVSRDGMTSAHFQQQYSVPLFGPFDLRVMGTANADGLDAQIFYSGLQIDTTL